MNGSRPVWHRFLILALTTLPLLGLLLLLSFVQLSAEGSSPEAFHSGTRTALDASRKKPDTFEFNVLSADESGITIEFSFPQLSTRMVTLEGIEYAAFDVPGLSDRLTDPELPAVPVWSKLVALPPGAEVKVHLIETGTEQHLLAGPTLLAGDLHAEVLPEQRSRPGPEPDLDALLPANLVELSEPAYVRDQRLVSLSLQPVRISSVHKSLEYTSRLLLRLDFVGGDKSRQQDLGQVSLTSERLLADDLLNPTQANAWRALPSDFRVPEPGMESGVPVIKIEVDADGLYQVTYDELLAAGMDVDHTNPLSFSLSSQGNPVAIEWFGGDLDQEFSPGEGFRFYGQRFRGTIPEEKYTDVNVYWLSANGEGGPWVESVDGSPAGAEAALSYRATEYLEEDHLWNSLYTSVMGEQDTWYWLRHRVQYPSNVYTIPITLTAKAPGDHVATLRSSQWSSCGKAERHVRLFLNDQLVADKRWGSPEVHECFVTEISGTVPSSSILQDGADLFNWTVDSTLSSGYGVGEWLNWLEVTYQRQFVALSDELSFGGDLSGTWTYTLSNWGTDTVLIWDVTSPLTPVQIDNPAVSGNGPYTVAFEHQHPADSRLVAVGTGSVRSPLRVNQYLPPDLDPPAGADWIAISPPEFITEVQRLADYRSDRGTRTAVLDINDLYNQFGHGLYQPAAIRDFLAHSLTWLSPAPAYVLLVGDGHWNLKGIVSEACQLCADVPVFFPPYLAVVDPVQGEVPVDNMYVTLVGDDIMPDMAIGRLPVTTITETRRLVDRIIDHEDHLLDMADWQKDVLLVAGAPRPDSGEDFYTPSDLVAEHMPGFFEPVRIYYGLPPYTSSTETQLAMIDALNQGASIVTYRGHGGVTEWDYILTVGMVPALTNKDRLPVAVSLDCLDTYFAIPKSEYQALSESLMRHDAGGILGHWGAAGLGYPSEHNVLSQGFFTGLFEQGLTRFGDAALAGKLELFSQPFQEDNHNLHSFTLLADPAMVVIPRWVYLPLIVGGG